MPFEMSEEFPYFSSKSGVGDFCSCKLSIPDTHPSLSSDFFGRCAKQTMSAMPSRADIVSGAYYVRFVPNPEVAVSFEHLVGAGLHGQGHVNAERFRRFKIDYIF